MTRTLRMAAMMLVAGALATTGACRKEGPKPRQAFETWLLAVEKCDSAAMRAGLTKSSIEQVEQLMKQLQAFLPEEKRGKFDLLTELCKGYKKGGMVVLEETVNGTQATLKVTADGKPLDAPMALEDGAWKLDFASLMKQSIAAAVGAPPPAPPASPPAAPGSPSVPPPPPAAPSPAPAAPAAPPAP